MNPALYHSGSCGVAPRSRTRAAKRAIAQAYEQSLHAALLDERRAFMALLASPDGREGVAAFLEKRRPVWRKP